MLVNKGKLAEILGVSEQTLTAWQDKGMPVVARNGRGHTNQYDTHAVIQWWIHRETGDDLNAERTRLTREQANKTALENGRLRGELVSAADVRTQLERVFGAIRSRILAIPTKFAPQVLGLQTLAEIRAALDKGAREALTELATFELDDADTTVHTRGTAGVPSATVSDGEPVGGPVQKAKSRSKRRAGPVAN